MWTFLEKWFGNRTLGAARSPEWRETRNAWIKVHPECAVCNKRGTLISNEMHHIAPFNKHPELENDMNNLITLCRDHHFLFAHLLSWRSYDPEIETNARIMHDRIKNRV